MKTSEVGVFEAKTQLSRLIEQVQATGQPIVITRNGKPVAKLCAVGKAASKRIRGCGAGADYFMAPDFEEPLDDFEEYRFTEAELTARRGLPAAGVREEKP
jgi:prevent-host-death family protein